MAELIGLVTSIGTVASAGFAVAKTISTLADELGSAAQHVRAISTDTKAVAIVLHELKRRLDTSTVITRQIFDVASEIADLCRADIDQIKEFLLPLLPAGGRNMSVSQKAKWLFAKSKISMRRSSLNSLKLTITLFLHTLDFIEGDLIDEEYMRDKIEAMVAESKNTKSAFLAAERTDQMLEKIYTTVLSSSDTAIASNSTTNADDVSMQLLDCGDQLREEGTFVLKGGNDQEGDTSLMNLVRSAMTSQLDNPRSNFEMIEDLSDDHFLQIAHHIRTQKVVTSYALVVLDGRHEKKSLKRDVPTSESNQAREPPADDSEGSNFHPKEGFPEGEEARSNGLARISSDGPNYTMPSSVQPQGYGANVIDSSPLQQQHPYQSYPPQPPRANTPNIVREDPEKEAMKQQLAEIAREKQLKEEEAKRQELERRIRQEAEAAFSQKMEQMRRKEEVRKEERKQALAHAKKEVENAREEGMREARLMLEAEKKAAAAGARHEAQTQAQADYHARARLEAELQAELDAELLAKAKRRKGLRQIFSLSK
ncbi:hypothetical protein GGR51DRAFT_537673 [Nemania sp. FL0031]|nr:hypothetical protein GGR51DRAFT_537673 [Nemania sp. FL0031]